jgi:peroxiredoxin
MNKLIVCLMVFAVLVVAVDGITEETEKLQVNPSVLEQIDLAVPERSTDMEYLGLAKGKTFKIGQVKANLLLVEIFSMYCPICQAEAPKVNKLYQSLKKNSKHAEKTKVLGIGTGNSQYEVDVFKKRFEIPFPLVPDPKFSMEKALNTKIRTPTFIAAKILPSSHLKIVYTHVGPLGDVEEFIQKLKGP